MLCEFCSQKLTTKDYLNHLNMEHPSNLEKLDESIININNIGMPIHDIANVQRN